MIATKSMPTAVARILQIKVQLTRRHDEQMMLRAYQWLTTRHPQLTNSLFDEHFLTHRGKPIIGSYLNGTLPRHQAAMELVEAWDQQLGPARLTLRKRRKAEVIIHVDNFLSLLYNALGQ